MPRSSGEINGPITVRVEITGTHKTNDLGKLLAEISALLSQRVGTQYMVDVDWGDN